MKIGFLIDSAQDGLVLMRELQNCGHEVGLFLAAEDFLSAVADFQFDLFILDWSASEPILSDILSNVKQLTLVPTPLVIVSDQSSRQLVIEALGLGASDCWLKPFRPGEFSMRATAYEFRNNLLKQRNISTYLGYTFSHATAQIEWKCNQVTLPRRHFTLAMIFFENFGRLFTREELSKLCWGIDVMRNTRMIDIAVSNIRRKLELSDHPQLRLNGIYQKGYVLQSYYQNQTKTAQLADAVEN